MIAAAILAAVMLAALVLYALFGGADYGAGVWDLFCAGPRAEAQRRLIETAIEPIWEANHVWLILVVVLLFSGFPLAFATISVGLAVPEFLILMGVVLRGASFVFRAYFTGSVSTQLYWGKVFSISSSLTPMFLGIVIGGLSGDNMHVINGHSSTGFLFDWLAPFPLIVGILALSLFAYLAACYLALYADDPLLQSDFRFRALASGLVSVVAAVATYVVAGGSARGIAESLSRPAVLLLNVGAVLAAITGFHALLTHKFKRARFAAAAQVSIIIVGWGVAQYPWLVRPDVTIWSSAAPVNVIWSLLGALTAGALIIVPALRLLFKIFTSAAEG